jgi:hypothetical protein
MTSKALAPGLSRLRRKRWFLWSVLLTYVPAIWLALELTGSDSGALVVFVLWIAMAAVAGALAAFSRCPRCGEYFHVKGLMPVWVRKCLHCGLRLTADRGGKEKA